MDEQALDPRSALSSLRRRRRVLLAAAALGAAAGLALVVVRPPMYVSGSLVLLPPLGVDGQPAARDVETEVSIASSQAVLGPAGAALRPEMSGVELARKVEVTSESRDVLRFEASADTAGRAQAIAQAVADSAVAYTAELGSSLTDAKRASLAERQAELQATLDTLTRQIETTRARLQPQDPNSPGGRADASALAQLTAQQADIVLQMDILKDRAATAEARPGTAATVIQDASPGERPRLATAVGLSTLIGLLLAVSTAAFIVLVRARRDQRVVSRDDIADAVGAPVLASVRSRAPRTVAEWASLLYSSAPATSRRREGGHYAAAAVEAWSYRQVLRALGHRDSKAYGPGQGETEQRHSLSVTVVTLSDDVRALAVGPQLASYAASTGVSTRLVVSQGHESVAPLWHACSRKPEDHEPRPGLVVDTRVEEREEAGLTIQVVVVDRLKPELVGLPHATKVVLAVSPGSATGEELARAAVAVDDGRRDIVGVIVADPDKLDRTTGRLLQVERARQTRLPSRLTGAPVPAPTNVSNLPRRRG